MSKSQKYIIKKARVRSTGSPIATSAYYGPTDQFASKVVVGILDEWDNHIDIKKWFSDEKDLRFDETNFQEIEAFIKKHDAYRVAMVDKIIGCPHEEGKDYPLGGSCPECPFWEGRDRWEGVLLQ